MKAEELRDSVDGKLPWSASYGVIRDRNGNDVAVVEDRNSIGDGEATADAIVTLANHATALVGLLAACERLDRAVSEQQAFYARQIDVTELLSEEYEAAVGALDRAIRDATYQLIGHSRAVAAIGTAPEAQGGER